MDYFFQQKLLIVFAILISIYAYHFPIRQRDKKFALKEGFENVCWFLLNSVGYSLFLKFILDERYHEGTFVNKLYLKFHLTISLSLIPSVLLALVLIDAIHYVTHRLQHENKYLWELHVVHHSSRSLDFFAADRNTWVGNYFRGFFETLIISFFIFETEAVIYAYIIIELNGYISHSYAKIPFYEKLSWLIVTPQYHGAHHTNNKEYMNGNYADFFVFWDKIFGTFRTHTIGDAPIGLPSEFYEKSNFAKRFFYPFFK